MLYRLIYLLFLLSLAYGDALPYTFAVPATQLVNQTISAASYCSYDSHNNHIIFSWPSQGTSSPYFMTLDANGNEILPPTEIPGTVDNLPIFSCYNSKDRQMIFAWASPTPYFAIYDTSGNEIVAPTQINSTNANFSPFVSYNSQNNQLIFTWEDVSTSPMFAIYNADGSQNIPPTAIVVLESDLEGIGITFVYSCYNSLQNELIFTWIEDVAPYFAIYSASGTVIVPPTLFVSSVAASSLVPTYDSKNNQILFSWAGASPQNYPFFAIYNASGSSYTLLEQISSSIHGLSNIASSYSPISNMVAFSWNSEESEPSLSTPSNNFPTFAVYSCNGAEIVPASYITIRNISQNVFSCYNSYTNQIVFTWKDSESGTPYFAIYTLPAPPAPSRSLINQSSPSRPNTGLL